MLLLLIDALLLAGIITAVVLTIRSMVRSYKKHQIDQALFRQQVAEDLAKQVDRLDPEKVREHEQKVQNKLNGLH